MVQVQTINTIKVPLMYHCRADHLMIVNRGRGLLSTCLAATMNNAKDTDDGCSNDGHTEG